MIARRKGRKLTSGGDNYEPFDELENVGFAEEPDLSLLFESTQVFYVHENCALWSDGVKTLSIKEEGSAEAKTGTVTTEKGKKLAEILQFVDKAVAASVNQKCAYCKHFGAR